MWLFIFLLPMADPTSLSPSFVSHTTSTIYNTITTQGTEASYAIFITTYYRNSIATTQTSMNLKQHLFCNLLDKQHHKNHTHANLYFFYKI